MVSPDPYEGVDFSKWREVEHVKPLPPLPRRAAHYPAQRGPTPFCNWVIPGRMMAGAYPAMIDDNETNYILNTLYSSGMTTFVCLQLEYDADAPEQMWRRGQRIRPYWPDAQRVMNSRAQEHQHKIHFLHLRIRDGCTVKDAKLWPFIEMLMYRFKMGENMYIHCWGGHGRTGTVVATMLGLLYPISPYDALERCQRYHDSRVYPQNMPSPATAPQQQQVLRLLRKHAMVNNVHSAVSALPKAPLQAKRVGSNVLPWVGDKDTKSGFGSASTSQRSIQSAKKPATPGTPGTKKAGSTGAMSARKSSGVVVTPSRPSSLRKSLPKMPGKPRTPSLANSPLAQSLPRSATLTARMRLAPLMQR